MPNFTVKPYIEKVLAELSGDNKAILLNFINGKNADASGDVSYELCESASAMSNLTAGVHAISYRFKSNISWKGYFIKTTNYNCFITVKNGIDLSIATVYINNGTSLSPAETITADCLRAYLREDSYVDTTELNNAIGSGGSGGGSGEIKENMEVWLFNENQRLDDGYQNEYNTSLNFAQLYQNHYNGNSKIWIWFTLYDNRFGYLDDASSAKQTALLLRSVGYVDDGTDSEKYEISFINSDNTLLITMRIDDDTMTIEDYDERHNPNQIDVNNLAYIEARYEDGDPHFDINFNGGRMPESHSSSEGGLDSIWKVNIQISDVYDFIAPEDAGYCSFGNDLNYQGLASIIFYNISDTSIECRINCGSFEIYYEAYYDSEEEIWTNQYLYIWGSAAGAGNGGGGGGSSGVTYHLDLSQFGDLPRASYGMSNPPHPNKYTYGIAEILKKIQYYFDDDYANEYALESQFYITDPNNYQERCPHSDISFLLIDGASDDDAWDALCAIDASDSIEISGIIDYSNARPFEGILENNIITLKRAGSRYYDENIYLEGDQYPVRGSTFVSDIFQDAEHNNSYSVSPVKLQVIAKTSWDYGYSFGGVYLTIRYIYPTVWTEDYAIDHALKCYVEAMALRKAKVTLRCEIYPRAMHSMLQEHNLYTFDDNGQTTNTQNVDFSNYCHYSLKYFDSTSGDLKDAIFYSNGSNYKYKDKSTNADLPYDTIGYAILEFDFSNLTFTVVS